MKRFDKLIKKLSFYFNFIDCFCLNYRLQSFKNEFCITNAFCHLRFCCRSPSFESHCRQFHDKNANDFFYRLNIIFL